MDLKRVSRLVVLPDYQGIGIGRAFLDFMAAKYTSVGHMFEIKTSARNLIHSLKQNPQWALMAYQRVHKATKTSAINGKTSRTDCKAASFLYKGDVMRPFV